MVTASALSIGDGSAVSGGPASQQLHLGEVLHVDQPNRPAGVIHNHEIVDLETVKNPQCFDGERVAMDVFGVRVMMRFTGCDKKSGLLRMWRRKSPSVMMPVSLPEASLTRATGAGLGLGHAKNRVLHRVLVRITGSRSPNAHDVPDLEQQGRAKVARRVKPRKILTGEAAALQQHHGERVPQREGRGRARRGREPQRAGFLPDAIEQFQVGPPGKFRVRIAGQRDEGQLKPFQHRQQPQHLGGLAAVLRALQDRRPRRGQGRRAAACVASRKHEVTPVLLNVPASFWAMWADFPRR